MECGRDAGGSDNNGRGVVGGVEATTTCSQIYDGETIIMGCGNSFRPFL